MGLTAHRGSVRGIVGPDPRACPDCGGRLHVADTVATCSRCHFTSAHPLASRVWQIDVDITRLQQERAQAIDRMRHDRYDVTEPVAGAPVAEPVPLRPPEERHRRALSVPNLLVGLGALLLVVAGIIFAAVTWNRLGPAGQAAVLGVATVVAVAATVSASRFRLTATAEALSVVAAGFALIDVHAVRVATVEASAWRPVWAAGMVVVAAGLLAVGRVATLRAPALMAVAILQVPLVVVASGASSPALAVASALVGVAALDALAAPRVAGRWLPRPTGAALAGLGVAAWTASLLAAGPDLVDGTTGLRWWAAGITAALAALAAAVAWRGSRDLTFAPVAAVAATFASMVTLTGVAHITVAGEALLLASAAFAVAGLAGSLALVPYRPPAEEGGAPVTPVDPRARAAQVTASAWAVGALLPSILWAVAILLAPLEILFDGQPWGHGPGATAADMGMVVAGPGAATMLVASALAASGAVTLTAAFRGSRVARGAGVLGPVLGVAAFVAVGTAAVHLEVPVAAVVAVEVLAGSVLVVLGAWPARAPRVLPALGGVVVAGSGLAWAGAADVLTVAAGTCVVAVGAVVAVRTAAHDHRRWATVSTVTGWIAFAATVVCAALTLGASAGSAWLAEVTSVAGASALAVTADRRARWLSAVVDGCALVAAAVGLVALAVVEGEDVLSAGLAVVTLTAAAHVLRPSRRASAAAVGSTVGLLLVWQRWWMADVRAVEAYALPAAAVLEVAGWRRLRRDPAVGSWPTLGPGLVVGFVPSALVGIVEPDAARPLLVLVAGAAVLTAGVLARFRAPAAVGAAVVVTMALDQLAPVVSALPRWLTLGTVGVLLLLIGATFERRRRDARNVKQLYRNLR